MRKLLVALALVVSSSATAHAAGLLPTNQLAIVPPTLAMTSAVDDDDDDGRPMPAGLSLLAVSLWAGAGLGAMAMLRRRERVCRIEA